MEWPGETGALFVWRCESCVCKWLCCTTREFLDHIETHWGKI